MRKKAVASRCLVAALTLGLAACATAGEGTEAEAEVSGDQISVQVTNDVVPSVTAVLWMVPETGSRRRLGSIPPNGRQTFSYLPTDRSLDHRLVAELAGGGRETTLQFSLVGVSGVRWDMSDRNVRVVR